MVTVNGFISNTYNKWKKRRTMRKLFIDDLREPPGDDWDIVRSYDEAIKYINEQGLPDLISFDHDLGMCPTGYDIAKYIEDKVMTGEMELPEGFEFKVHSSNPVGAANITRCMTGILNKRKTS